MMAHYRLTENWEWHEIEYHLQRFAYSNTRCDGHGLIKFLHLFSTLHSNHDEPEIYITLDDSSKRGTTNSPFSGAEVHYTIGLEVRTNIH
jgi:hypothetical protein